MPELPHSTPQPFPRERSAYKRLLLTNPNYFGNLQGSPLQPVLPIADNTHYEELACIGFHPQQERLEGVVYIYQPSGYGTDVCGPGTPEYVRFYLSFDGGTSWHDQGMTSFQAFNIPEGTAGRKRLEYAVSLAARPPRKSCRVDSLIRMRAILSWSVPPPPNQPAWTPVWGNRRDAIIQVEPRRFLRVQELLDLAKVAEPSAVAHLVDFDLPLAAPAQALGLADLAAHAKATGVPVHRFAFKELSAYAAGHSTLSAATFKSLLPGIDFNPSIVDQLAAQGDGDTSYEELTCIGLDPNAPNALLGIIHVKKPNGYSGGPCTHGSREYVAFWADVDGNGSYETWLGTAEVQVYDLPSFPEDGVRYAVRLPVDLDRYRQPCRQGPRVMPIRAVLSWNVAPPPGSPNQRPVWGNREETLIHIAPVAGAPAGKIAILGGIPVSQIHPVSGLTTPNAVFAATNLPADNPDGNLATADGRPCPFGGLVTLQGAPLLGHTYKVEVTPAAGGAPTAVVTELTLVRQDGTTYIHTADPMTLRFAYRDFTQNVQSLLALWWTNGDDAWEVKLTTFGPDGRQVGVDTHRVQLDNTAPEVSIEITSGPGGCGKFPVGTELTGRFVARDAYLAGYGLGVEPAINPVGVEGPDPSSGVVQTAVAPGNSWTLDTTGMKSCGYVLRVVAWDCAIVNSAPGGHVLSDSVGFCLKEPGE